MAPSSPTRRGEASPSPTIPLTSAPCAVLVALAVEASAAHPLVPRLDVAEEVRGHEGESVTQGVCARAAECGTMRERESQRDKENEEPSIGRGRTDKSQPLQALQKRGVGGASRRGEGLKGGEFFCAATPRWLTLARSMLQDYGYLGDSILGRSAHFGCGSLTANLPLLPTSSPSVDLLDFDFIAYLITFLTQIPASNDWSRPSARRGA